MIERLFSLLLLLLCIVVNGFSQSSSQNVIVYSGGKSQEFTLSKSSSQASFKVLTVDGDGGSKDYTPTEIDGFLLGNGMKYLSFPIRGSQEKVFFKILFEGEISLGYHAYNFFLIKDQEAILLSEDSGAGGNIHTAGAKRKTYLGVLHFAMDGCSEYVTSKINSTRLSFPSLESLLIAFHDCKGVSYRIPGASESYIDFGISLAIGYALLDYTLKPSSFDYQTHGMRVELMGQFGLNKFIPRLLPEVGVAYSGFEDTWVFGRDLNPGQEQTYYEETYRMRLFEILVVFNYKLIAAEKQELYIGLGPKYTIPNKKSLSEISQYEYMQPTPPNTIIVRPRDPVLLEMQSKLGYLAKLGYARRIGKYSPFFEVQYDRVSKFGFITLPFSQVYEYSLYSVTGKVGVRF